MTCEYCGKSVYKTLSQMKQHKHHYCSNQCQLQKQKELKFEHRVCEVCGTDIYVSKKSRQRFCSDDCQHQWQKTNVGYKNPKFEGGVATCENCHSQYLIGKYRLHRDSHHFCSTECRQEWYRTVWSQSDEWREESRLRAAKLLQSNVDLTQTKPQIVVNRMLRKLGFPYRNEEPFKYYAVDNYLFEQGLIIEVMGDYWHCSPIKFPHVRSQMQKKNIGRDKAKHTYFKQHKGIEILYLWESDILDRPALCEALIDEYVRKGGNLPNYHSFNYILSHNTLLLASNLIIPHQDVGA